MVGEAFSRAALQNNCSGEEAGWVELIAWQRTTQSMRMIWHRVHSIMSLSCESLNWRNYRMLIVWTLTMVIGLEYLQVIFTVWSMKIDKCFNPDWYSFLQAYSEYIFLSADFSLRLVNNVPGKLIDCTSQNDISKTSVTMATRWRWNLIWGVWNFPGEWSYFYHYYLTIIKLNCRDSKCSLNIYFSNSNDNYQHLYLFKFNSSHHLIKDTRSLDYGQKSRWKHRLTYDHRSRI